MLDEEVIVKGAKNSGERFLILNTLLMFTFPALLFGGNSDMVIGLFIALGILAPLNIINYKRIWIDAPAYLVPIYILALSPYIISTIIAWIGINNSVLIPFELSAKEFFTLDIESKALIVSAASGTISVITPELSILSAVACGLSVYFITNSRYIIRRIFFYAAAVAGVLAIFGFVYAWLSSVERFMLPSLGKNPFATFSDASQWCAFALLWQGAALTVSIYSAQRFRIFTFLYSIRCISIIISFSLLLSVCYCGTPLSITLSLLLEAVGFFILFIDAIPTEKNLERHWTSKYLKSKYRIARLSIPAVIYFMVSIFALLLSGLVLSKSYYNPNERLISDNNKNNISLFERKAIVDDLSDVIEKRPLFGWGTGSFGNVLAFYQGGDLGDSAWLSPKSDFLKKYIENGFVGIGLSVVMPLIFFAIWLFRHDFSASGFVIFFTILEVLALSLFDYPFESLAVLISFWIILMSAFRWDSAEVR